VHDASDLSTGIGTHIQALSLQAILADCPASSISVYATHDIVFANEQHVSIPDIDLSNGSPVGCRTPS